MPLAAPEKPLPLDRLYRPFHRRGLSDQWHPAFRQRRQRPALPHSIRKARFADSQCRLGLGQFPHRLPALCQYRAALYRLARRYDLRGSRHARHRHRARPDFRARVPI